MQGIDFDIFPPGNEYYDGAAKKTSVSYHGVLYMIKYPAKTAIKNDLNTDYSNSPFSEYISCQIINALRIPGVLAQKTLLGESMGKVVVACEDFTTDDTRLVKFNMIQNAHIDSEGSGRHPILEDVLETYKQMPQLNREPAFIERFWDTFILDAFLGNFDRHAGNWGFLNNRKTGELTLAPIYDCGSCLYPSISKSSMESVLEDQNEINKRLYDFPKSAFQSRNENGKLTKLSYREFMQACTDPVYQSSLIRVTEHIDMETVEKVIAETPYLEDIQKRFYCEMLRQRLEKIVMPTYEIVQGRKKEMKKKRQERE